MFKHFSSLTISLGLLIVVLFVGSAGYIIIEDYSTIDAFFMTIITVSTVGFGEIKPLSPNGRLFTSLMIIFSLGLFAYAITSITRFIVDGGFTNYFANKRNARKIKHLNNHVIVCGFGRNGSEVARVLSEKKQPFLVIDISPKIVNKLRRLKILYIEGDSSEDYILEKAGIKRAKSLITTIPNDADNLLVTLSARTLNKNIRIISRASYEWSDVKLKKAGANNVIMPDIVGGRRMAKLVASPDIVYFLEYMRKKNPGEVQLVELSCNNLECSFINKSIGELNFKKIVGVNIVGLKTADGHYLFNPPPEMKLEPNHKLFVMGNEKQLKQLQVEVYKNDA